MAKGATSKSKTKNEENRKREEEQQRQQANQKRAESEPQRTQTAENKPTTQEAAPKPTSTQIPTLEPKYASAEQIEEARNVGRRSLEMARSGQLKDEAPFSYGVRGIAEQYDIPKLEEAPSTTMPSDEYAPQTRQERTGKGYRPSPEEVPTYNKNAYKSEQRGAQSSEGSVDILGTRRPNSLSEEGQRQVDSLSRRIASLQNTPITGDAAIDEVTQRNNQDEIAKLQRQIDTIYNTDNSDNESNVERYLDPNYKLSKYEEQNAEQIFDEYLENNPKAKELYNTTDAAMSSLLAQRFTPEEAEEYARMVTLKNKTSDLSSAGLHMAQSMPFVKGLADKSTEAYGELKDTDLSDYNYSSQLEQTQTQNPLASTAGNMGYQLGSYAAFAPLVEGIPVVGKAAERVGSLFSNPAVGEAAANIVRGQAADTILDTLPNEVLPDIMEGNWRDLPKDIALNQLGNLAFNVAGEGIGALARNFIPSLRQADEVADAVKQNELDPADLARQNEIDVNAKVDNVNQAVDEVENLAKQADEVTPKVDEVAPEVKTEVPVVQSEKVETPKLNNEEQRLFNELSSGYNGTREWWQETIDRAQAYINEGGDPNVANNALAELERLERESKELIDLGGTPTWSMPRPSQQLDGVAARINQTLDNVSFEDEIIAREANAIRKAIDNYRTALEGDSLDAINQARRDLYNACKRFDGRAKKISLEGYDGSFGKKSFSYNTPQSMGVGSPQKLWQNIADAEENNRRLLSGIEPEDTITKLLNGETLEESTKAAPEVNAPKAEPVNSETPVEVVKNNEPIDLTRSPSNETKERGTSEHIRSIEDVRVATPMKMEGVSDEVVADFVDNPDMYKVLKNADTKALADDIYNSGDQAVRIGDKVYTGDVETKFGKLLSEKNPAALPLGHQLAKDYSEAGNHDMAAQIYRRMGEELTKAGQFSQAAAINMMRNDPLTALQYAEKQLDAINQQGAKRFGDKWKPLSLTDDEIQAFNSIAPGNADAIKALYDKIGARLGKEYPTTFMEKLLEGRKVAMLFNVRTNVRNVGANIPTLGLRWVSDRLDAIGEGIAHIINPNFARKQGLIGSGISGRKIATEIYNSPKVKALIEGTSGKYEIPELQNSLMKDRQMFKGTPVSKWINRMTNGGIEKVNKRLFGKEGVESGLETIRNATYKMLNLGDTPFVRENFIERLGSYIHAQGIKDVSKVPDEAIQTAWEEAMKATYKDNSWAVKMLGGIKGGIEQIPGVGKSLSQAVIPFLQAPGNIAARMVDYSPINATKGVYDIISGAANKSEKAVRQGIDEAAKGLTGSGLIYLGMKLREAGLLTGDYSEDKDQKNFEKQNGFIPWSLHIGDKYFQYDWAQPFAEPLIVGSLLQEAISNSDQYDSDILNHFGIEGSAAGTAIGLAKEGTRASVNSWFNASPLQGLAELMSGGYNGTDIAQNIFDAGVSDFAGAFVPSLVNAIAKTEDTTQRQTYDPSNKFNTFLNQQQAKIPGLSEELPIKYDTWGEEMKYANSKPEAFAQRFAIPGNYGTDTNDPIDMEINNLFDDTQDAKVFPWTAANKVGDRQLNNREISNYQRDMGQRSRQVVEGFINSDVYKTMTDDEKVNALNEIYNISKTITERDMFGKPVADNSQYKNAIEAYDEGKIEGILDYINAKNNPYGLDSKVYQKMLDNNEDFAPYEGYKEAQREYDIEDKEAYREAYVNGGKEALAQEVEYQNALKEFDLSDSKIARNEWDRALHASADPMAALQKVAESKTLLAEANVQGNSKIGEAIQAAVGSGNIEQAQSMVQSTVTLQSLGLDKPGPAYTYDHAQSIIPGLTVEQFAQTYQSIDADGNQGIKQGEIIDYLNANNISSIEGGRLWNAYGNSTWKKIPVLGDDGVWSLKAK